MKNLSFAVSILLAFLILFGCSSETFESPSQSTYKTSLGKSDSSLKKREGAFIGPLFDLETSPNQDILVADAGAGVTNRFGAVLMSLPGVNNIATIGAGSVWATTGPGGAPTADTGQALYRVSNGRARLIANLYDFEAANNPDGQVIESNPYSVVSLGGNAAIVADAAGNDLLRVDNQGNISLLAVFPEELVSTANMQSLIGCPNPTSLAFICNVPMMSADPVPTSVVVGPDGYYYVGELKGFPSPTGASNIWKIAPDASGAMCGASPDCVKAFDGGFTSIVDMVFGADGRLYVAELDANGWFAVEVLGAGVGGTIKACDPITLQCETIATGIPLLTAIAFGEDGSLWATRNALIPGLAEVFMVSE